MKIYSYDKILAYMALSSGLLISAVAIYYSVAGLVSIFAAAAIPIIIMGVALETGKLIATLWLKQNWNVAPAVIRYYLLIAVLLLMAITSMGIFGYLSKAHLDQAVPTSNIAAEVAIIDEKIADQQNIIALARKSLDHLDASVDQLLSRSTTEAGVVRANQLRRSQAKDRAALQQEISTGQQEITKLINEKAPIAKELRVVEAEVGPIKYIAALIYGEDVSHNSLEQAVRWVIILLVVIFDPLAVVLLLASQYSFQRFRENPEERSFDAAGLPIVEDHKVPEMPVLTPEVDLDDVNQQLREAVDEKPEPVIDDITEQPFDLSKHVYLKTPWAWRVPGVEPVGPQVYRPEPSEEIKTPPLSPDELIEELKVAFPECDWDAVRKQERLTADSTDSINTDEEAYMIKPEDKQIKMVYVQNSEQSPSSLWNKVSTDK